MYKKPIFWIIFTILVILSIFFVLKNFPKVFSFVNLDISMDRKQALEQASIIAEEYDLGPEGYEQAVIFDDDYFTQIYVELEGGGKEVFNEMLKGNLYKPYKWQVRLFRENETKEVKIWFTPAGRIYGFQEKLPETEAGTNISPDSARVIAEIFATEKWNIDLAEFELVEDKKNEVICGRIDHSFVYERPILKIEEARYRLQITISGDKVTEVRHFMKIPEAFHRRYREMRSANNTIASGGMIAMVILYGIGGIIIGSFILLRKRWILWRKAVLWAFIIAFLGFIAGFNYLPLYWNWYDTALSKNAYLFQQIIQALIGFITNFMLLALTFIAAESLTRKAFPNHLRFWEIWKKDVANSKRVLGNTISGYFVAALSLVFIITFYFITNKYFNWWNPAGLLIEPNTLATPFPWLSAIANSLHAGFWEECLFRAIPLAGAVLIGAKLGKKKLFLGIGLIVQALIFGMGHANYAAQPAYARVVELFIPSLYFAFLYLRFGLLTGILMHFAFDAILMSLPIWISSTKDIWLGRSIFLILFFIPLFIVLNRWFKSKKLVEIEEKNLNRSWQPLPKKVEEKVIEEKIPTAGFNQKSLKWILIFGIIGILLWLGFSDFHNYYLPLKVSRKQAISTAKAELERQGIELSENWEILAQTWSHATSEHRFTWQEGGTNVFEKFIGKYIAPASWRVRFLRFEGDVAERAEEYNIFVRENGKVYRFWHQLPEEMKGKFLEKEEAQKISYQVLKDIYGIESPELKELSALPEKLPNRKDWIFTYEDTLNYNLAEGELRYTVDISGDLPTYIITYVYAPEDWLRDERNQKKTAETLTSFFNTMLLIIFVIAVILGIIQWTKKKFSTKIFLLFLFFLIVIQIILFLNSWQTKVAWFSTSEPFGNQVFRTILGFFVKTIFFSFGLAVIAGLIPKWQTKSTDSKNILPAFGWSGIVIGIAAVLGLFAPSLEPFKPSLEAWGTSIPLLDSALNPLLNYLAYTLLAMFIFTLIGNLTVNWSRKKLLGILLLFLISVVYTGNRFLQIFTIPALLFWFATIIVTTILLFLIYRNYAYNNLSYLPVLMSIIYLFRNLQKGMYLAHPVALMGSIVGAIIIILFGFYWSRKISS